MINETHIQQREFDSADEAIVTADQIDRWSAEMHEFFRITRLRLSSCGNGHPRTTAVNATQPANDPLAFENESVDVRPILEPRSLNAHPNAAPAELIGTPAESTATAADPLHRLHEMKRRLAARMQSS